MNISLLTYSVSLALQLQHYMLQPLRLVYQVGLVSHHARVLLLQIHTINDTITTHATHATRLMPGLINTDYSQIV